MSAGLIVNEASNGASGSKEFFEFVAVGNALAPTATIDLEGWILDDNNGDWQGSVGGAGIAPGAIRFDTLTDAATCGVLAAVPVGSMIVVYNAGSPNDNLPADDVNDSNGDGVYIIPHNSSCMKVCAGPPTTSDSSYAACNSASGSAYNKVALRNGGDVAQSRNASGALFHGFAYGSITVPYPAGSFNVDTNSGSNSTFLFSCGDWYDGGNFSKAAAISNTPGSANNVTNQTFIDNVKNGVYDYSNLSAASNCASTILPALNVEKSVVVIADPVNGTVDPKSIPGSESLYTVTLINTGLGVVDADTAIITDPIPTGVSLFVNDLGTGSPITFSDGGVSSALSLSFTALNDLTDDIEFSNNNGATYAYIPNPDAEGYDENVTNIRLLTKGSFAASDGSNDPTFSVTYQVRVE